MENVICLVSGGMDSVTALHYANKKYNVVSALSFNYGSKHNDREILFAVEHCEKLEIEHKNIELPFINTLFKSDLLKSGDEVPEGHYEDISMKRTVVPFRNGIMLSIAAGYAESIGAKSVIIAAHVGDHAIYPDCRMKFMKAISMATSLGTYGKIKIEIPFIRYRKEDIAKLGNELGVDFARTWSCYKGGENHCGKCGTCVERKEAFVKAKIVDPTIYGK